MSKPPRVTVRPLSGSHRRDQRLVEFSHPTSGNGGLIAIEAQEDGTVRVEVFRVDRETTEQTTSRYRRVGRALVTVVVSADLLSPDSRPGCEQCGAARAGVDRDGVPYGRPSHPGVRCVLPPLPAVDGAYPCRMVDDTCGRCGGPWVDHPCAHVEDNQGNCHRCGVAL